MTYDSWRRVGHQIGLVSDSSAWWMGDWLLHGEKLFPDRYRRAIQETTLDYQTLRNYAWVARRFAVPRRHKKLSFQHHAEVASLAEEEQDGWLAHAEGLSWSRNKLRNAIRASRRAEASPDATPEVRVTLTVPTDRERRWQQAAEEANCSLADWMAHVLDEAAVTEAHATQQLHTGESPGFGVTRPVASGPVAADAPVVMPAVAVGPVRVRQGHEPRVDSPASRSSASR